MEVRNIKLKLTLPEFDEEDGDNLADVGKVIEEILEDLTGIDSEEDSEEDEFDELEEGEEDDDEHLVEIRRHYPGIHTRG